ncbi:MAG: hypothetical protein M1427_06635 [Candidatus Thermoplasmatota archaeon]|nr:hypothetical protein [Candidatus Thermoplasmatota archaeon]
MRTHRVTIVLSPEELDKIRDEAKKAGITPGEYSRFAVFRYIGHEDEGGQKNGNQ